MTLLDLSAPFLFRGRRRYYGSVNQLVLSVRGHCRPPVVKHRCCRVYPATSDWQPQFLRFYSRVQCSAES